MIGCSMLFCPTLNFALIKLTKNFLPRDKIDESMIPFDFNDFHCCCNKIFFFYEFDDNSSLLGPKLHKIILQNIQL